MLAQTSVADNRNREPIIQRVANHELMESDLKILQKKVTQHC